MAPVNDRPLKFIKKDLTDYSNTVSLAGLKRAFHKLDLLVRAVDKAANTNLALAYMDSSRVIPLLDQELDALIDDAVSGVAKEALIKQINELLEELASVGVDLSEDLLTALLPPAEE